MPGLIETRDQEELHLLTESYEGPSARGMVRDKQVLPKSRKVAYYVVALGMLILVVVCLRVWTIPADLRAQMQSPPEQKYAIPPVPNKVNDHNGVEWPPMFVHGSETMHFFIIGDWGGLDGFIDPPVGGKMVMYDGGNLPGPHVFAHRPSGCTDGQMSLCFNSHGAPGTCIPSCGYNESVDREPQYLVANQMKRHAAKTPPKFILNVGDNFYWGGIPIQCGSQPMAGVHWTTAHMFDTIFRQVYNSPELNNVVWFSVLGNHDYGGWLFTAGWDQQIAFTWHDQRWRLPAQYWKQHVAFPEQSFTIDILLTDSNVEDAVDPAARPTTNICGCQHNSPGSSCASVGGPVSMADCPMYFAKLWQEQIVWVEKQLKASQATWQVIVTHFPCGHQPAWYNRLHVEFGLDFLVTGHTHIQHTIQLGGLLCVISGGGGGILSESASHGDDSNSYGFYDATINRTHLVVESINFAGRSLGVWTTTPAAPVTAKPTTTTTTPPARLKAKAAKPEVPEQHGPAKPPATPKKCTWCKLLR